MPSCVKCGTDNTAGQKYCSQCGAVIPQMAPTGDPTVRSGLDLDENTEYLTPTSRYSNEELSNMAWAAHDWLVEGAELEPFIESYQVVKQNFLNFQGNELHTMEELLSNERQVYPDDPYPKQMTYLLRKGVQHYEEGIGLVEHYLTALDSEAGADDEELKRGINRLLDGNDHFCLAMELVQIRVKGTEDALRSIGVDPGTVPKDPLPLVPLSELGQREEEEAEATAE